MSTVYRFRQFSIDVQARELRFEAGLLKVSPKVFDCIVYLIEHRERAVGRDELIAAVWSRADVAEAQLAHLMRKLRHTLRDNGKDQSVIHTIPRFGFRWVAQTERVALAECVGPSYKIEPISVGAMSPLGSTSQEVVAPPSMRATAGMRYRRIVVAIAAGVALVGALGVWFATSHRKTVITGQSTDLVPSSIQSGRLEASSPVLAVLPVAGDIGGDAEWMQLGLMDLIAGRLRGAGLTVVPSEDTVPLLRQHADQKGLIDRARVATGAGRIIVGTITRTDDGWWLRLELHGPDSTRVAEAHGPDAILVARAASDQLLDLLGAPRSRQPAAAPSIAEALQRAEAALLVDDFGSARRLIENAPTGLREMPEAQLLLGRADVGSDHPELAVPRLRKLLASLSGKDSAVLRARALTALGVAELGQPETAEHHFTEAIELLETLDEPGYLGDAYNGRGVASGALGNYEDALDNYARARIAFNLAGDAIGLARVDNNEAAVASARGRSADALPLLIRTAERFERIGALDKLVSPLVNLVSVHLDLLRPADALAVFRRNASRFDSIDNTTDQHVWMIQGANVLVANGKLREAEQLVDRLTRGLNPAQEPTLCMFVDIVRAELEFASGKMAAAASSATRAISSSSAHRFVIERARIWLTLLRAERALHRDADANAEFTRFTGWSREADSNVAKGYQALANAEEHIYAGDRAAGWVIYEQAMRSMKQDGTPADIAAVAISYGGALIDAGDLPRASTTVGSLGRCTEHDYGCALLQLQLYRALGQKDAWRSALENVRALAGDRRFPRILETPPVQAMGPARH